MYEKQVLGPASPSSLIYSVWMMCTLQFGMRTGKETHDLRWGDVALRIDDDGHEYIGVHVFTGSGLITGSDRI